MSSSTQVEITKVPEALKLLNTLVERGEKIEKFLYGAGVPDFANALIPAMVKGAEAVLELMKRAKNREPIMGFIYNPYKAPEWAMLQRGIEAAMIEKANSYRPAMVELGWVPE